MTLSWVIPSESYDHSNPHLVEITPSNLLTHIAEQINGYVCFEKDETHKLWCELLFLCRADALSQADKVCHEGKVIDSKRRKLKRIAAIENAMAAISAS